MTATTHSVAPEDVMAYLDGELSAVEAQAVAGHIDHCAECAALAEELRGTSRVLSRWSVPTAPAGLEDWAREMVADGEVGKVKVSARKGLGNWKWGWKVWAMGSMGVTAVFLLAVMTTATRRSSHTYAQNILWEPTLALTELPDTTQRQRALAGSVAAISPTPAPAATKVEGGGGQSASLAASAPMIARTVSLAILVKDVGASRSSLDLLLARHHGYAAQLTVNTPENGPRNFEASLRIPVAEVTAAVADLRTLGRVLNETQSGEEVTQQHADLAARLQTARETEEKFRAILQQRTGKVSDVLEVEEAIERVRGQIEGMEAEQMTLEHRVDFASVEVRLGEEYKAQLSSPDDSVGARMQNAFVAGYRNAMETVVGLVVFVEEYGPSILIWVAVLGLPVFFVWRRYRRVYRRL
jgi:Domain of unknown function (DUF4349)/Putative zinc-finger